MALPSNLSRHMNKTIVYERYTGTDNRGARTFATAVSYTRCRVTRASMPTKNPQGQSVVSTIQVTVDRVITTLSVKDKITLDDGSTPPILNFHNPERTPVGSDLGHSVIEL
jgi:hypothetical protein